MHRTPEQEKADGNLEQAIEAAMVAYFPQAARCMVTDFVVVVGVQELDEGEQVNGTYEMFRNGTIAGWKALGLLEMAKMHLLGGDQDD